ncbi:exocyst complex component exo70a1 [Quercus suber]|uniref:Exocyst subunit Exo70 family protein n=1 Tax=Quercus suber TaxID=58331 RepID=A0AAW0JEM5_QUESU
MAPSIMECLGNGVYDGIGVGEVSRQVKLLYAGKRIVCDQIFEGFDSLRDQCFGEVTASSVSVLLSFGDAIAKSKRSPEKLFVLLDMYEIMRELHSEIEMIFKGKTCSEIRDFTFGLRKQLAQTAQETFEIFEEAVEKDANKIAVLDGTVHPLTSYDIPIIPFFVARCFFPLHILQCLTIQGLTSSGGGSSVGGDGGNSSGVPRALVKDRLITSKIFIGVFHWTVLDTELRVSLRLAVAEVPLVESGKNPQKYIKYGAEDLERMLGEFLRERT